MILQNYEAMQYIVKIKEKPLTVEIIRKLLSILDPDQRIRAADDDVRVIDVQTQEVLHTPPPWTQIERSLEQLCEFANEKDEDASFIHPVVRSIAVHFWIGYLHPFTDGNGRTARALFYWSMLHREYWLWEYISISTIIRGQPSKYARAFLYSESDEADLTYFILHQMGIMLRALDALEEYMTRKVDEIQELSGLLRRGVDLNHRQIDLVQHGLKDPNAVVSFRSHMNSHGIVYQTARADLLGLVQYKLFEVSRRGRRMLFRPAKELEAKVRTRYR